MARDYKNRSSRKGDAGGGRLSSLMIFMAGAVTGICAAIILYLFNGIPAMDNMLDQRSRTVTLPADKTTDKKREPPDNTEKKTTPTPKFDFYTILPEMEVSVPEWEGNSARTDQAADGQATQDRAALEDDQRYILQVGSFRQPDEADRVKAKLALIGIEAQIQRVVIDGGDVWHRVRVGPYQSTSRLHQTRQRLIENDIDFMLLKLKQDKG